ncbi:MAG: SUF system Fe-S cluster assembly protein [Bacteroidota bacterium]|nr:SUF system Fe-S cluster assembly protein [Candidatus Kapabacteria bacterium]MCX7937117.1 SUF system Fe-S cluster assembly protein [Chlorobiota bacterium]MDW8074610.1 SUF system Fe-S cluster assembly protein [Bacteroidota bacterium]
MATSYDLKQKVIDALRTVYDPEIPVNIYDLGLVYDVSVRDNGAVHILMTVTAPNCPVADTLPKQVEKAVASVEGVSSVSVELTFDPPWDMSMIPDHVKLDLGIL